MNDSNHKTLFSGNIYISYSQFDIECKDPDTPNFSIKPFEGQENGLCDATQLGCLSFIARPKDAVINIQVQLCSNEPPIDSSYQEIIEVSFKRGAKPVLLREHCSEDYPLNLPAGEYRVRYCIDGFDKDYEEEEEEEEGFEIEKPISGQKYLIQFWLQDHSHDVIIKQTTELAAHWHKIHKIIKPKFKRVRRVNKRIR